MSKRKHESDDEQMLDVDEVLHTQQLNKSSPASQKKQKTRDDEERDQEQPTRPLKHKKSVRFSDNVDTREFQPQPGEHMQPDGEQEEEEELEEIPQEELTMIHASQVTGSTWTRTPGTKTISSSSSLYKYGGPIHRISFIIHNPGEPTPWDVMLCCKSVCTFCSGKSPDPKAAEKEEIKDMRRWKKAPGVLHSIRDCPINEKTRLRKVFDPPRMDVPYDEEMPSPANTNWIVFRQGYRAFRSEVHVCKSARCKYCRLG